MPNGIRDAMHKPDCHSEQGAGCVTTHSPDSSRGLCVTEEAFERIRSRLARMTTRSRDQVIPLPVRGQLCRDEILTIPKLLPPTLDQGSLQLQSRWEAWACLPLLPCRAAQRDLFISPISPRASGLASTLAKMVRHVIYKCDSIILCALCSSQKFA